MAIKLDGTAGITSVDGSATVPSHKGSTGGNTAGIFYPAANTIAFTTSGAEAMRIDSSGNIGIGTSSPSNKLTITSTSAPAIFTNTTLGGVYQAVISLRSTAATTGAALQFYDGTNDGYITWYNQNLVFAAGGNERMRIDSSGNVGIGTSSPTSYVNSGSGFAVVGTNSQTQAFLGSSASGVTVTAYTGAVYFQSSSSADFLIGSSTANPVIFRTSATERMRIDSSGNVGIGTASPGSYAKLASLSADDNNTFAAVASNGLIRLKGYLTSVGGGVIEATNIAQSAYAPMFLNGSTLLLGTGGSERMRIAAGGSFVINGSVVRGRQTLYWDSNTETGLLLMTTSSTFNGSPIVFYNGSAGLSGFISQTGSAVSYNTSSDYRLKENVQPLTTGLATVSVLKPVQYNWKIDGSHGEGFIAHELQEFIPLAVSGEKDAVNEDGSVKSQGVDYSKIVVHLVAAIQELSAKNDLLEARLAALENK